MLYISYKLINFLILSIERLTGSQATPFTRPVWPFNTQTISGKFSAFQTIIVLSTLQLASHLSLGDQARSRTSPKIKK